MDSVVDLGEDDDDLIRVANTAGHGLAAGVFTKDLSRAFRFGEEIEAGLVNRPKSSTFITIVACFRCN